MIEKLKKVAPYLLSILLIALIIYLLGDQRQELTKIFQLSAHIIAFVVGIFLLFQAGQAMVLKLMLKSAEQDIGYWRAFRLICLRSFFNYLPLNAGMVSVGVLIKRSSGLPFSRYFGMMTGIVFISLLSHGIVGAVTLLFGWQNFSSAGMILIPIVSALLVIPLILIFVPLPRFENKGRITNLILQFKTGWEVLRQHKLLVLAIMSLQIVMLFGMSVRFWLIAGDLNLSISFIAIIFVNIFGNILRVNTIFPGNWGMSEAVAGTVAATLAFDFMDGFLPAVVDHLISMIIIFLFGIPLTFFYTHRITRNNKGSIFSSESAS